jgi:Flp pilus assembly protein TadD
VIAILVLTVASTSSLLAAEDGAALLTQARTHLAKGRYEEAIEVFERAGVGWHC